jgi:hypothetical protein
MPVYRLSRKFILSEHAREPIPCVEPASSDMVLSVVFLACVRLSEAGSSMRRIPLFPEIKGPLFSAKSKLRQVKTLNWCLGDHLSSTILWDTQRYQPICSIGS